MSHVVDGVCPVGEAEVDDCHGLRVVSFVSLQKRLEACKSLCVQSGVSAGRDGSNSAWNGASSARAFQSSCVYPRRGPMPVVRRGNAQMRGGGLLSAKMVKLATSGRGLRRSCGESLRAEMKLGQQPGRPSARGSPRETASMRSRLRRDQRQAGSHALRMSTRRSRLPSLRNPLE